MADKPDTLRFYRRRLPHWEVVNGRYFITLRLHGSLPSGVEEEIQALLIRFKNADERNKSALQRQIFRSMEEGMDRATTNCHLRDPKIAEIVQDAIVHRHRSGVWKVIEFVIMPNHLHLFIAQPSMSLGNIMESFKAWTAKQALSHMENAGNGFWQREWFDHWSRSGMEDEKIINYIRNNPVKAGMVKHYTDWPYGSWATDLVSAPE